MAAKGKSSKRINSKWQILEKSPKTSVYRLCSAVGYVILSGALVGGFLTEALTHVLMTDGWTE